ncbi:peptide tarsal-less AA [Episyrphus balteatus]|nr:peptide tarsal-less AA [Episyrphus balteatus]
MNILDPTGTYRRPNNTRTTNNTKRTNTNSHLDPTGQY